ncbi:IPT/TIG domain-containing protein [Streptomyces sp. HC307]|uniref:IPT/TIG domain-containing protein n=1 Tax=Streptomyces flavusporus TaxID=3385496 RepID=UPI0039171723
MAAPVVSSVSPSQGPPSGGTTVIVTGTDFTSVVTVRFGFTPATSFTVNSSTQITAVTPSGSGTVNVTVTTNQGTSTQSVPFTYATTPTLSGLLPNQGPVSGGTTVTLTGTGFTDVTAVRFGGVAATSFTVNSGTQITAVSPARAAGPADVTVTASGGTSNALTFTYVSAPTLSGLLPNQGPVSGGTTVTLTGTGFTNVTAVRFGGVAATSFTVNSGTQITAVSPARAAGPADVTVTASGGTSNALTFTYVSAPTLSGLLPNQGPVFGGTTVTLTGTGFTNVTAVRFGGVAATSFTVNSGTQITAVTPAHAAGAAAVTVTTLGGTSDPDDPNAFFYYIALPTLTAIDPASGPTAGGTTVRLTGNNLLGATAVRFDGVAAASFTVDSATQITAVTRSHAPGATEVTVTTPGGTSNPLGYVFLDVPVLASLVPAQGPTHAGTVVTLTGSNLAAATRVQFGAVTASFTVVSPTQVTSVAPAGPAGPVSVTVTTPAATSNGRTYTRVASPAI